MQWDKHEMCLYSAYPARIGDKKKASLQRLPININRVQNRSRTDRSPEKSHHGLSLSLPDPRSHMLQPRTNIGRLEP